MDSKKPRHMSYKLLNEITGGFSKDNLIGSGGFGVVYKGVDIDGQEIAVKLLNTNIDLDGDKFRKELDNISGLKHSNIVQLVGFCCEEEEEYMSFNGELIPAVTIHRALCFEYMPNGSLDRYISDEPEGFSWQSRYRIIKGICEGLKYLHTREPSPICHLDLKPENVLLDNKMTPKIADFGLSRFMDEDDTKRTATLTGTLKYMPPEFIKHNLTSKEYDIYSLGVIIIMIMVGPTVYSLIDDMKPAQFVELVHKKWRRRLQEMPAYISFVDGEQVKKCIEIASKCIEEKKSRRPSMEDILDLLSRTEKYKNDLKSRTEKVITLKGKRREMNPPLSIYDIPMDFLKKITNCFGSERELAKTAFGEIFKGLLEDGRMILVKRLSENSQQWNFFYNEISILMGLDHENIVKLVGFSNESTKKVVQHNGRYIVADSKEFAICYEYLALGSLDKYIFSKLDKVIDWDTCFNIIMGICKGLHFLHMEMDIIHMDITGANILLDYKWVPKIGNFHVSRLLAQEQTNMNTEDVIKTLGHMAPEYMYSGEISAKTDIYSLGLLIMEIMTGVKVYPSDYKCGTKFIEMVRKIWTKEDITSNYSFLDEHIIRQAKACFKIAFQCVEVDQTERPSTVEIINQLNKIKEIKPIISTELLNIYTPQLCFAFTPKVSISLSLQLTNKSRDSVAVRLQSKGSKRYKVPLFGIVPPRSTYTLVVTTRAQKKALPNNESLTLESIVIREGDLNMKFTDADSVILQYRNILKKAIETDTNNVREVTIPVACTPSGDAKTSSQPLLSEVQAISNVFPHVLSVDVHPTKPWIMTSHHGGNVVIWNHKKQEMEKIFKITTDPVYSIKFIEREQLLVAGDSEGTIYVYMYYRPESEVWIIEEAHDSYITSLDVHPTEPFLLSSSDDHLIKLWDWDNDWKCIRIFEGHSDTVTQVNFIPTDANYFASASLDHTIRIWDISSSENKMTLRDRPDGLLCMHHYISNDRKYLISGVGDGCAQVWDVEKERCVHTFEGHVNRVSSICSHTKHGVIITGSYDGTVRVWNSTTYRLENIICVNLGAVCALGYIESLNSVVIGCYQGMAIVELNSVLF